jgi:hypothetical protein
LNMNSDSNSEQSTELKPGSERLLYAKILFAIEATFQKHENVLAHITACYDREVARMWRLRHPRKLAFLWQEARMRHRLLDELADVRQHVISKRNGS